MWWVDFRNLANTISYLGPVLYMHSWFALLARNNIRNY